MASMAVALPHTVLMVAPSAWPDRGGVEQHLHASIQALRALGWHAITLVPPKHRPAGKLGLLWLWGWMLLRLPLLSTVSVIHIHDVFLWFWPVWPLVKLAWLVTGTRGNIITTFHGWEGDFPPTPWQKCNKWLAQQGSTATVAVGDFINQLYPVTTTRVTYGGVANLLKAQFKKQDFSVQQQYHNPQESKIVYIGRLAVDTGLPVVLTALKNLEKSQKKIPVEFWGDGVLQPECQKQGEVKGWVIEPQRRLLEQPTRAWVIASGYLSALEALAAGQRVIVVADNPLKQIYYATAPFLPYLRVVQTPQQLEAILSTDPARFASAAKLQKQVAEITERYGWDRVAGLYQELYVS